MVICKRFCAALQDEAKKKNKKKRSYEEYYLTQRCSVLYNLRSILFRVYENIFNRHCGVKDLISSPCFELKKIFIKQYYKRRMV